MRHQDQKLPVMAMHKTDLRLAFESIRGELHRRLLFNWKDSINYDLRFASLYDFIFSRLSKDPVSERVSDEASHRVLNRAWDKFDRV